MAEKMAQVEEQKEDSAITRARQFTARKSLIGVYLHHGARAMNVTYNHLVNSNVINYFNNFKIGV